MKRSQASLFALAGLFAATSVLAQQAQGMVNVDLGTVANTIAKNIKVDVEKIPASLQVPVGVAATACGVPAAKLAPAAGGDTASCQATGTSAALDQVVAKQVKAAPKQ
jgi:hypothetical protein